MLILEHALEHKKFLTALVLPILITMIGDMLRKLAEVANQALSSFQ
jgi:hypothetical protein